MLFLTRPQVKIDYGLQIVHDCTSHWVLASNFQGRDNIVKIYDSVYSAVSAKTRDIVKNLFQPISGKHPQNNWSKVRDKWAVTTVGYLLLQWLQLSSMDTMQKQSHFFRNTRDHHQVQSFKELLITPFPTEIIEHWSYLFHFLIAWSLWCRLIPYYYNDN